MNDQKPEVNSILLRPHNWVIKLAEEIASNDGIPESLKPAALECAVKASLYYPPRPVPPLKN